MTDHTTIQICPDHGYSVQKIHGCRIIFGSVPMDDFSLLLRGFSNQALIATDIAGRIGATFVVGEPKDIDALRNMNLLPSLERRNESVSAMSSNLPLVAEWLLNGERGLSSEAMCYRIFGYAEEEEFHPHDPDDLRRCMMFVEATQCADKVHLMTDVSPEWASLVERWDELISMLKLEMAAGTGQTPKTYAMMKEILAA